MTHYSGSFKGILQKDFIIWSAFLVALSGCVSISSSGETMVDGKRVVGNIHSNGVTRTLSLNFAGQDICSGTYSGSAALDAKPVLLSCTNGFEGTATVDAAQVRNIATVDFQIPDFHSGRIAISLGGEVSDMDNDVAERTELPTSTSPGTSLQLQAVRVDNEQLRSLYSVVRSRLRDPSSAIFGDHRALRKFENGESEIAVCGLVNAKNVYGGYTGEQMYLAIISGRDIRVTGPAPIGVAFCSRYGFPVTVGGNFID